MDLKILHSVLAYIVEFAILLFEYVGTFVIIVAGIQGVINYIRKSQYIRLDLARGMAMGLEFKLGGEILKTVIITDLSELYIIGGIILLRAALTFLIHWEIQGEAPKREGSEFGSLEAGPPGDGPPGDGPPASDKAKKKFPF